VKLIIHVNRIIGRLTCSAQMEMPSVVCLRKYIKVSPKTPPLNRSDLFDYNLLEPNFTSFYLLCCLLTDVDVFRLAGGPC
jgi:hypothetical protein